jgi:hypothetical protein
MQVIEEAFGDVPAGLRRFSPQIIQQKLAAMSGRQLFEFFACFGMLFEHGRQLGGHGNIARRGVELQRYTDHVARVGAACLAQRGVNLQAETSSAGRYQRSARGAVIYCGYDGNVFRRRLLAFLRSRCCVFAAVELLDESVGNFWRDIHMPHHPDLVNCREKFLRLTHHRSRIPQSHRALRERVYAPKCLSSRISDASSKMAFAISIARGSARGKHPGIRD